MDTEAQTPPAPVPVGTLYMHADGNFSIQSLLTSPRDLARVLSSLTTNIVAQLSDPPPPPVPAAGPVDGGEAA